MEQVLTNLIDNAIRHTNAGGHVTLVIDTKNNGLIFEVQDSGAGIPEEDIPFYLIVSIKLIKQNTWEKGWNRTRACDCEKYCSRP